MLGKFIFYPAKRMHNSINNKSYSVNLSKDGPGTNLERCALEVFLDLYGFSGGGGSTKCECYFNSFPITGQIVSVFKIKTGFLSTCIGLQDVRS